MVDSTTGIHEVLWFVLLHIGGKCRIAWLRNSPWQLLKLHAVEYDGSSPYVNKASIILLINEVGQLHAGRVKKVQSLTFLLKQLRSYIRLRPAQPLAHVRLLFPAHSEHI